MAKSCLEGLIRFVKLRAVNSKVLQTWLPERNVVCDDKEFLECLHDKGQNVPASDFAKPKTVMAMMKADFSNEDRAATVLGGLNLLLEKLGDKVPMPSFTASSKNHAVTQLRRIFGLSTP